MKLRLLIIYVNLCLLINNINAQDILLTGGPLGVEQVARRAPAIYESKKAAKEDEIKWIQIDLGKSQNISTVKLFPAIGESWGLLWRIGFPIRFKIEASNNAAFSTSTIISDYSLTDFKTTIPRKIESFSPEKTVNARYVRLTANKLALNEKDYILSFYKIEILSNGQNVALNRPLTDSDQGFLGVHPLTCAPRPMGDGIVTDNPQNVTQPEQWKPVKNKVEVPVNGVTLNNGVFKNAYNVNIGYLLTSFSVDDMLKEFRNRTGIPNPTGLRKISNEWVNILPGSAAGRFLMGSGNSLRWIENTELRQRQNLLVEEIRKLQMPNGYLMGYPEKDILDFENGAYCRAWLTHGLIEADLSGNKYALPMLRSFYDWFNESPYLPELNRRGGQGRQGIIANTRMYFTPVGKPSDLQVVQRYYQENFWLDQLSKNDSRAIWEYPYDKPHSYMITTLEAYFDLYKATGNLLYKKAVEGGWKIYHEDFSHKGGSLAICENDVFPPKSYYLTSSHTGELCGSVFWIFYNQRFHLLYPESEKYVAEIEKSIYNVALANQAESGIRYHAFLAGKKDRAKDFNTCCEGQGTRLYGALPEFIYTKANDGIYVNLFAASSIKWIQNNDSIELQQLTEFPYKSTVILKLKVIKPTKSNIRLRIPSWAKTNVIIALNGNKIKSGKPGSYLSIDRIWKSGDEISFNLDMTFKLSRYEGKDKNFQGKPAYSLEYGPILMAFVGKLDKKSQMSLAMNPNNLLEKLSPVENKSLLYSIEGDTSTQVMPYWLVDKESFTCFPFLSGK